MRSAAATVVASVERSSRLDQLGARPPKKSPSVAVLPAREHVLERSSAMPRLIIGERRRHPVASPRSSPPDTAAPAADRSRDCRRDGGVIDQIAVDVDVVLIDAPAPGEAVRIQCMDEDQRRCRAAGGRVRSCVQSCDLDRRAGEPLDAVRAADDEQNPARILRSHSHDIAEERSVVGRRTGMPVAVTIAPADRAARADARAPRDTSEQRSSSGHDDTRANIVHRAVLMDCHFRPPAG